MSQKFRVTVPADLMNALPEVEDADSIKRGVDLFQNLTERMRTLGAPGIHLYVISDTTSSAEALRGLAKQRLTSSSQ